MDEISGFLRQPFVPAMLGLACIPALLLVGYVVFFYVRAARKLTQRQMAVVPVATAAPSGLDLLNEVRARPDYTLDDLPDLGSLVGAPARQQRAIVRTPQTVTLTDGTRVQAQEMMSILRDERDGRLLVLMPDGGYRSLATPSNARREFTRIMKELSSTILQSEPGEPAAEDSMRYAAPVEDSPLPAPEVVRVIQTAKSVPMPGDLPSFKLDDHPMPVKGRSGRKVDFVPPPAIDIPSAIEAYLQWRLAATGEFDGRQFHVTTAPGGGVRIRVDNDYYDFVDDIRDSAAKAFIKQTIAEWQERQG